MTYNNNNDKSIKIYDGTLRRNRENEKCCVKDKFF